MRQIQTDLLREVARHGGTMPENALVHHAALNCAPERVYGEIQGLVFERRLNRTVAGGRYYLHVNPKKEVRDGE